MQITKQHDPQNYIIEIRSAYNDVCSCRYLSISFGSNHYCSIHTLDKNFITATLEVQNIDFCQCGEGHLLCNHIGQKIYRIMTIHAYDQEDREIMVNDGYLRTLCIVPLISNLMYKLPYSGKLGKVFNLVIW